VSRTVPGTSTEPTLVTPARSAYKVVVEFNTRTLVVLSTRLDTTRTVVGTDVVTSASVIVEIGSNPLPAGPEKTEILCPAGTDVDPLTVWRLNGLSPEATV